MGHVCLRSKVLPEIRQHAEQDFIRVVEVVGTAICDAHHEHQVIAFDVPVGVLISGQADGIFGC